MINTIKDILLLHEDKKNAISSSKIAEIIGIDENATYAKTRGMILECAKQHKLPLAAYNKGYYLIADQNEYDEYMRNLDARRAGIEERKRIITENYQGERK